MTYKLGDFISCLKYIDVAMIENPDYEKGHKLKKRIYDECPYIDPDPSNWNKEPDLSRIKFNQEPKPAPVEKELYTINISKWNLATLAESIYLRYTECGETKLLLEPCNFEFKEKVELIEDKKVNGEQQNESDKNEQISQPSKPDEDDDVVILGSDDDIVILDDDSDENDATIQSECESNTKDQMKKIVDSLIDNAIFCVSKRESEQSSQIVSPIVHEIVDSVVQVSTKAFIQSVLFDVIDESVTENYSFISNLQSASKRKVGVSQFLSEVPSDLIEKRRSTRAKGTAGSVISEKYLGTSGENTLSSPRCEEVTAKQLLQGYFPKNLIINDETNTTTISPEKKLNEEPKNHTLNNITISNHTSKDSLWLSSSNEKEFVESYINKVCSTPRRSLIRQMEEFLLSVASNHGELKWPKELCDVYLKCYVTWRGHTYFPDEFETQEPHQFIPVVIIANEIVLQMKIEENVKVSYQTMRHHLP